MKNKIIYILVILLVILNCVFIVFLVKLNKNYQDLNNSITTIASASSEKDSPQSQVTSSENSFDELTRTKWKYREIIDENNALEIIYEFKQVENFRVLYANGKKIGTCAGNIVNIHDKNNMANPVAFFIHDNKLYIGVVYYDSNNIKFGYQNTFYQCERVIEY